MTAKQETQSVGEALRNHREDNRLSKAAMYRALGVSPGTYDTWEGGVYIPGDEYAERIAELLGFELREVVWMLYRDRLRPEEVSPLSLDLGEAATSRYDKLSDHLLGNSPLTGVERPTDNRPPTHQAA
jgi:transcriptional regulator with XRE-family HTH domain